MEAMADQGDPEMEPMPGGTPADEMVTTSGLRPASFRRDRSPLGRSGRLRMKFSSRSPSSEHQVRSGIHGHDLALGSGSVDGVFGTQLFVSWRRVFATAALQYALRGDGDFDYSSADQLTWAGGPGAFAFIGQDESLAVQLHLAGETKGKDTLAGARLDDTALTALFLGPGVIFTWDQRLAVDVAAELPVFEHNSGLQAVPDYRLRGSVIWNF